jgi:hypothetical protein
MQECHKAELDNYLVLLVQFPQITVLLGFLKPTGYVMHHQVYDSITVRSAHACVLYLFEKTNDLCHLHHKLIGFYN